jgi:hypothetical protein
MNHKGFLMADKISINELHETDLVFGFDMGAHLFGACR